VGVALRRAALRRRGRDAQHAQQPRAPLAAAAAAAALTLRATNAYVRCAAPSRARTHAPPATRAHTHAVCLP
jgi:hypothetical protein